MTDDRRDDDLPITTGAAARIDRLGRDLRHYIDGKLLRIEIAICFLGLVCVLGLWLSYNLNRKVNQESEGRRNTSHAEGRALCDQQTRGTAALRKLIIIATVPPKPGTPAARSDDPKARQEFRVNALALIGGPRPPCLPKYRGLTQQLEREHVLG